MSHGNHHSAGPARGQTDTVRACLIRATGKLVDDLLVLLVRHRIADVMSVQLRFLRAIESITDLEDWADRVVAHQQADSCGALPLGSLISSLAHTHEPLRLLIKGAFDAWRAQLAATLTRMQHCGELAPFADPASLSTGILATAQGGMLLAATTRDIQPLQVSLCMALDRVNAFASNPGRPMS